jgi:hypothetical protein
MNKFIKSDIEQGLRYFRTGIMNALADIENGNEKEIELGEFVPFSLVVKCAEERGWESWSYDLSEDFNTYGLEGDCWYTMRLPNTEIKVTIYSCLWKGQKTAIRIDEND